MTPQLLQENRDAVAGTLSEWCAVIERTPVDPTSSATISDGMGGFLSKIPAYTDTDPSDTVHYRVYKCRRTVPHTLLRNTQTDFNTLDQAVRTIDLILPYDAFIYENSYVTMCDETGAPIPDETGANVTYKTTRIELDTDVIVRHILCTQVIT